MEQIQAYLKDKSKIDIADICCAWQWLIGTQIDVIAVTVFGDLFLTDEKGCVNWLDTSAGHLTKVAENLQDFDTQLKNIENVENWFLTNLLKILRENKVELQENEVYSYKLLPIIGGDYTIDNIVPTDISVHFHLLGLICEQTKDTPDGTIVKIVVVD